jgi:DNA-binding response OmpR family regulator
MNGTGVVLIVDDHAALAGSLVSMFSAAGFEAQAVHTGTDALAFLRGPATVALILLDMFLPDMSGVDVLRAIRAPGSAHSLSLPVVMFSADDEAGTREELIQLGATDFVCKVNPGELMRVVSAHMRPPA